jgi:hypothetical protein
MHRIGQRTCIVCAPLYLMSGYPTHCTADHRTDRTASCGTIASSGQQSAEEGLPPLLRLHLVEDRSTDAAEESPLCTTTDKTTASAGTDAKSDRCVLTQDCGEEYATGNGHDQFPVKLL